MKLFVRIGAVIGGAVVAAAACYWMCLYSADLPSLADLHPHDPAAPAEIHVRPDSLSHVVPSDRFGKYLVSAVVAAEGQPDPRGPMRVAVAGLFSHIEPHDQMYSLRIARDLVSDTRTICRETDELRLAQQIQRRFDQQQIMTIYMNRVYLGEKAYGVEDASMRYFGKHAADLSLDEAALLAGLIRAPSRDSPIEHPERAVQRRN